MCPSITRYSTLVLGALLLNMISCRKHRDETATAQVAAAPVKIVEDTGNIELVAPVTNQGRMRFQFGLGADPDARSCDLWWGTTWRPSNTDCPDCTWTADVDFEMDDEQSVGADGCVSDDFTDFTLPLGYEATGQDVGLLWYYASGYAEWYPFWSARWDEQSGALDLYGGTYEESLPYTSAPYYYTSWWSGYATVTW